MIDANDNAGDLSALVREMPNGFDTEWTYMPPQGIGNREPCSVMEDLVKDEKWDEFLDHLTSELENPDEMMQTQSLIRNREYREICQKIVAGNYVFSNPLRIEIPKPGKKETRKVYTFKNAGDIREHTVVRMISWLMNRYNYLFQPNLFSVSQNDGVRGAINHLLDLLGNGDKHCYKADLSNFFNSIDVDLLMIDLERCMDKRDANLVKLLSGILKNPVVKSTISGQKGMKIIDDYEKGVMAGMPFQSFLSNFFLKDLDWILFLNHVHYYRYADDMMVVSDSSEELDKAMAFIQTYVDKRKLLLNPKKVERYYPGEDFIFLGICFSKGNTTISDNTVKKQKTKIRMMSRKYRRRYEKGLVTRDVALAMMVRWLIGYHYGSDYMPYSFSKMYFPLISSSQKLNIIDRYAQMCIRYVYTGKMRQGSCKDVDYETLKTLGYLPLVSAYRIYKEVNYHKGGKKHRRSERHLVLPHR